MFYKKTERTRKIFGIISIFKTRPRAKIALILSEKNIFYDSLSAKCSYLNFFHGLCHYFWVGFLYHRILLSKQAFPCMYYNFFWKLVHTDVGIFQLIEST